MRLRIPNTSQTFRRAALRPSAAARCTTKSLTARLTTMARNATALILGIGLLLGAAGCASNNAGTSGNSDGDSSISFMLDWTPNTNHIGLYVAQKLGYFDNEGVDVTILPTAQAGAETSVENGVADVGFTTLSNVAAFNAQGANLKMVFDLTQQPVARWCALASHTDIATPKDFDGKTFVSFGSAEQTAVLRQMIRTAGGTGDFETATAGTNTFQALTNGQGDFGGFYATWENVESELHGPALHCFVASDWGVPGNPDQLGFAVNAAWLKDASHGDTLRRFLAAVRRGYNYALANPDEAADILVDQAGEAQLDPELTHASMQEIVDGNYWTTDDPTAVPGTVNLEAAQAYIDFLYENGTYTDADGSPLPAAPQAADLATNEYLG
ncbi:putative solute binding protein of ABC transporter [Bifidobacterium pullorum]|uniref:Thiamine pyrimidine synthase n=1 Tax=Bifidobacterium pullorum TaxID=78448 RepID=A0A7V8HQ31_9BIFI|nr:putative solute binding protein of ABC transporter [Bifidobacterium pullorum]